MSITSSSSSGDLRTRNSPQLIVVYITPISAKNHFTSRSTYGILVITNMALMRDMSLPRGISERKRRRLKALLPARNGYPSPACTCKAHPILPEGTRTDFVNGQSSAFLLKKCSDLRLHIEDAEAGWNHEESMTFSSQ